MSEKLTLRSRRLTRNCDGTCFQVLRPSWRVRVKSSNSIGVALIVSNFFSDYSENENWLKLINDNGYHYFLSIAAIQSTVVYPSYRMATSQEWIIDQKKEFFWKSRQRKKISKDLFRKRSDSAIRFRSYPVEKWSKLVRFHKKLIS